MLLAHGMSKRLRLKDRGASSLITLVLRVPLHQPPALLMFVTTGQTAGHSQGFTTSENQHQLRNSGATCLRFEVWLLVFTVLFLKCIKDV